MGFGAAVPEAPGFGGIGGVEEVGEVGGVVVGRDLGGEGFGFAFVEGFAGDLTGFAGRVFGDAGAPAFAGDAHGPAFFGEDFRPAFEFGGEHGHVVACFLELPGVATGKDDGSGGGAFGDWGVGVGEEEAFFGDTVEGGGFDPGSAVGAGVGAPVVGDGEEDVWAGIGGGSEGDEKEAESGEGAGHGGVRTGGRGVGFREIGKRRGCKEALAEEGKRGQVASRY